MDTLHVHHGFTFARNTYRSLLCVVLYNRFVLGEWDFQYEKSVTGWCMNYYGACIFSNDVMRNCDTVIGRQGDHIE